jgi:hypothetical protein
MSIDVHAIRREVLDHLDTSFDRHRKELLRPRAVSGLPDLRVARIRTPNNPVEPVVFVTFGAWEAGRDRAEANEFMLLASDDAESHADTLADVVDRERVSSIRLGSTIALGRPWTGGATCDHLLVTRPYAYGEALERVPTREIQIAVRWLVPITAAEAALVASKGAEELEQRLQLAAVDFLAVTRPSVC